MSEMKCPVMHGAITNEEATVTEWWPQTLNLDILHQHDSKTGHKVVLGFQFCGFGGNFLPQVCCEGFAVN